MSDLSQFEYRLAAVERAVVDGDYDVSELADVAAIAEDVARVQTRLDDLERRLADLEGTSQAIGGFVGNVRSVNEDVERRADAAIATVDRLERRLDELERSVETGSRVDGRMETGSSASERTGTPARASEPSTDDSTPDSRFEQPFDPRPRSQTGTAADSSDEPGRSTADATSREVQPSPERVVDELIPESEARTSPEADDRGPVDRVAARFWRTNSGPNRDEETIDRSAAGDGGRRTRPAGPVDAADQRRVEERVASTDGGGDSIDGAGDEGSDGNEDEGEAGESPTLLSSLRSKLSFSSSSSP